MTGFLVSGMRVTYREASEHQKLLAHPTDAEGGGRSPELFLYLLLGDSDAQSCPSTAHTQTRDTKQCRVEEQLPD